VLVIYSTRRDAQVAEIGERNLPRILDDGLDRRLDYYAEFIDPARFPDDSYQEALVTFLRNKYKDHRFEVVVTVGADATGFVARHPDAFSGAPPVVFYGTTPSMTRPANSTGVIAAQSLAPSVTLAAALDPALEHIFVVTGSDRGDRSMERLAREQLKPSPGQQITYLSGLATRELEDRLSRLPPHSMVLYLLFNQDSTGQYFHPLRYLERVIAAANAPTYTWVDSAMGIGVVGGHMKSQSAQIAAVGELALRVLKGERAADIPVITRDLNTTQVDWRQLARWGFTESRLPAGTTVLFREPSLWDRYRSYVITALAVLIAQFALIAGLLVQRARRMRVEQKLRENQVALGASYDRIRDLGGRLLTAQDKERAFIARELHDDVGQQLALIEIDLKLLNAVDGADSDRVAETVERVRGVARSLRELSHRLHPVRLRLIGLDVALKGLQSDAGSSGVEVVVSGGTVPPALPQAVTLAIFRVAQEAVQNARKYSRGHRVSVTLSSDAGTLRLVVEDDGVGFDVADAWGRGLGLVSMKERIEGVGGRLDIRSGSGGGTRVEVTVPLLQPSGAVAV